ncbi:hypothetical protein MNBD_PLANCTO02-1571 [hydrothermal vent metagenome]|uniref:Uncharacterized protein n=1 Tax=hydrothermal vent metagenome TaxID=652676 RepID=A0A3B1DPP3_9ZZZZ
MSPNEKQHKKQAEKQIEQLLRNYFRSEMPEAIRQLPEPDVTPLQEAAVTHAATPSRRSFSAAMGLIAASCALVMIVIAVGIPWNNSVPPQNINNITPGIKSGHAGQITPATNDTTTQPVEMGSKSPFKKPHSDFGTGDGIEQIVPQLVPHSRIKILPIDDEDDELIKKENE